MKLEDILNQVREVEEKKLKEDSNTSAIDPRVLVFKKGATYKLRLLPNTKDVNNTFVTYEDVGFTSKAGGGEYIFLGRSPSNAGVSPKNDLVRKTQWAEYTKAKESGDEDAIKAACKLIPSRKQLANVYLHEVDGDDKAKEKIGQNLVLKYPARIDKDKAPSSEIYKVIHEGLFGKRANNIGLKAFDLSKNGRSLIITVGSKGEWNSYSASWDDAEDLGLSAGQIKEKLAEVHDLTEFVPTVKEESEIKDLLDEHWFVKNASLEDELDTPIADDDDLDYSNGESADDGVDDLLDGLDK